MEETSPTNKAISSFLFYRFTILKNFCNHHFYASIFLFLGWLPDMQERNNIRYVFNIFHSFGIRLANPNPTFIAFQLFYINLFSLFYFFLGFAGLKTFKVCPNSNLCSSSASNKLEFPGYTNLEEGARYPYFYWRK